MTETQLIPTGTRIRTTRPNEVLRGQWSPDVWNRRQWGIEGVVTSRHDSHGICYEIRHPDNSTGVYDPSEIEVV
jgi:hypothetical protein